MSHFDDNEDRITGLYVDRTIRKKLMGGGYALWDDGYFIEGARVQVTIKDVSIEWGGKAPKKWGKAVVKYEYNGQARSQNVMSFANPEVFKKVQELVGETVDIEVGKNDRDFTEWRSITATGGNQSTGSAPTATQKPASTTSYSRDFETKEERARRQVLIVKQSSLAQAVEIVKLMNPKGVPDLTVKDVTRIAQDLVDWVLDTPADASGFDNMSDDIPFN